MTRPAYQLGFKSLSSETEPQRLTVRGKLPEWLAGTLLRTGPAKFEVGRHSYRHWFDGLAMLHQFSVGHGEITYRNRFLQSQAYRRAMATGNICFSEFATDPCRTLFQRVAAFFIPSATDNCNVNVDRWADSWIAFTETRLPIRFDPETLATLGHYRYDDTVTGHLSTAHPQFDFTASRHYSYMANLGRRSEYRIFTTDAATGQQQRLSTLPVQRPAYMHSFGMSENFLVLTEWPLTVHPLKLRFRRRPFIKNYRWQPDQATRFWVIDKQTGQVVTTARGKAQFGFHHVNAFECEDDLLVDVIVYPDCEIIDQLYLDRLRAPEAPAATGRLVRFRIPLSNSAGTSESPRNVSQQTLSSHAIELPRIDARQDAGRKYRVVHAVGNNHPGNFIDQLVRLDLDSDEARFWSQDGCYPGEPVFIAAPAGAPSGQNGQDDQDDAEQGGRAGVILSVVLNAPAETSFLLVLDASTYRELARAEVPHPIPFGFHGQWEESGE